MQIKRPDEGQWPLQRVVRIQANTSVRKLGMRKRSSTTSKEHVRRPEAIGFESSVRESAWETRFTELEGHQEGNSHCNVPQGYQPNPPLGN